MYLGQRGTGWLSEKNTHKFFSGYCKLSEDWRSSPPDLEVLNRLYKDVESYKYPPRAKSLLRYKVLQEAKSMEADLMMGEYFTFTEKLRKNGFWLEKAFSESQNYASNSFLAAQSIHLRKGEQENLIRKISEPAAIERSKSSLVSVFRKIRKLGTTGSAYDLPLSKLTNSQSKLFLALASIHYEVTENMDHWMYYSANKRCTSENRNIFGDTLLLEVKLKSLINSEVSRGEVSENILSHFSNYPVEFSDYLGAHVARSHLIRQQQKSYQTTRLNFVELNYLDNGRGIENNIRNFAKDPPNDFTLQDVIVEKISSRDVEGAGLGFWRMVGETRNTSSLLFIQSGDQILSVSGHGESELRLRITDRYLHGTIITVLVPIVLQ